MPHARLSGRGTTPVVPRPRPDLRVRIWTPPPLPPELAAPKVDPRRAGHHNHLGPFRAAHVNGRCSPHGRPRSRTLQSPSSGCPVAGTAPVRTTRRRHAWSTCGARPHTTRLPPGLRHRDARRASGHGRSASNKCERTRRQVGAGRPASRGESGPPSRREEKALRGIPEAGRAGLDEHGGCAASQVGGLFPDAEQGMALVVQVGARGGEVLGHLRCCSERRAGGEPGRSPPGSWIPKARRPRKRSIRFPVLAVVIRPASRRAWSGKPRWRRWSQACPTGGGVADGPGGVVEEGCEAAVGEVAPWAGARVGE